MTRCLCLLLCFCFAAAAGAADPAFTYQIQEGLNLNTFLREGRTSVHFLLRSGNKPRILAAFPAGNSGAGLWFEPVTGAPQWRLDTPPHEAIATDSSGRPLYGMAAEASIETPVLKPRQAVVSSVRFLRDYQTGAAIPAKILVHSAQHGSRLTWARDRLDGGPGYRLSIEVTEGTLTDDGRILAGPQGRISLEIAAFSGETPLSPLSGPDLLKPAAAADQPARNALTFLSYREKFLAGSWRFNTYFGRDTLMSVRLLLPVLAPEAAEAGLGAVLARLDAAGEVAHEEGIGEYAVVTHGTDMPVNDYGMIDGTYMLAPVACAYLLDTQEGKVRAAAFLASSGNGKALSANLTEVASTAAAFAREPVWFHLIRFKPGKPTGQWRDSEEGNGRGVYAYDVNAVLVPAALEAADRLLKSGLLDPYLDPAQRQSLAGAEEAARIWASKAPSFFDVEVSAESAQRSVANYAASQSIPPVPVTEAIRFHALSLTERGAAVPVLHSDEGFSLLFAGPDPAALRQAVTAMMRPFPLGLMTDAGLVVANPVFAGPEVQSRFSRNAYHGTVIWSWQQALLAAGMARQLGRADLPAEVKSDLRQAQDRLWAVIGAAKATQNSELWSWQFKDGKFVVSPFGASESDEDESNAAQLWSTVYLAVRPPSPSPR